ncbi:hypothetical protein [Shinella zoogloeoides]|uniref:hypothetical protein n=1 Tax=Shinella zoogloeoides TaxID=352475 RepID=UPI00299D4033|nr:hypothetical protein [Shinella zoogloeoides]
MSKKAWSQSIAERSAEAAGYGQWPNSCCNTTGRGAARVQSAIEGNAKKGGYGLVDLMAAYKPN